MACIWHGSRCCLWPACVTCLLDAIDTLLKGERHFAQFGSEYLIRTPLFVILCLTAIVTDNRTFHRAFVAFALVCQGSWIWRLFDTIA